MPSASSVGPARPSTQPATLAAPGPPVVASPTPLPSIPGYAVRRLLGRGGMGVVFEAIDSKLNRPVALKVLADGPLADPGLRGRFRDEAEAVARLQHPNVVQVYDFGEHDGRPFLALELVRGGTLADLLADGPLPVATAVELMRDVARAVQHAHDRGVLHRDLKPGNILLGKDDGGKMTEGPAPAPGLATRSFFIIPSSSFRPKVTDFGLAKFLDDDRRRTRSGVPLGTPSYMAPEVATGGAAAAGPAADVYALGAVLYECLTGRPPAEGSTFWATIRQAADVDPDPPARVRPGVSRALDAVCLRALAKDPRRRYPTAAALADDLDRVAAGDAVLARRDGVVTRAARALRRRPVRAAAALVALGLAAVGGLHARERAADARDAARSARDLVARGAYADAEAAAERGLRRAAGLPLADRLTCDLEGVHRTARRGRHAAELHGLVDRLRYGFDAETLSPADRRGLLAACDALWAARRQFDPDAGDLGPDREAQLRADLLDLALLSADLLVRDGSPAAAGARLAEAAAVFGPDPGLGRVRASLPGEPAAGPAGEPGTAWEWYALGRARLTAGDWNAAAAALTRAADLEPRAFWPNFHAAACALKCGRADEAAVRFTVCLALNPDRPAPCHYNRAVALAAVGTPDAAARAAADLRRAVALEPDLADARDLLDRLTADAARP